MSRLRPWIALACCGLLSLAVQSEPSVIDSPPVPAQVLSGSPPQLPAPSTPQTLKVTPGVNEIIPVAVGHLNRIITPFEHPQVRTVSQATTQIEGAVLYVATPDEAPVTLYITPGGDEALALSLTLAPRRIPPREIHLTMDAVHYQTVRGSARESSRREANDSLSTPDHLIELKRVLRALAQWQTPKGFALREPVPGERIRCHQPGVQVETGQVLEGSRWTVLVGVARHSGSGRLELDERGCAGGDSVLAVAAWPNVLLEAGGQTELYVIRRRPVEASAAVRPSLLNRGSR